jgi:hypothetical protein
MEPVQVSEPERVVAVAVAVHVTQVVEIVAKWLTVAAAVAVHDHVSLIDPDTNGVAAAKAVQAPQLVVIEAGLSRKRAGV